MKGKDRFSSKIRVMDSCEMIL